MSKKLSKIKLFFILHLILILLSGCNEFKDIDKNIFVSMIGIDQSDNPKKPYKVTLKLYVPTSSFKQDPKPNYTYLTKNGETLSEAIRLLESYSDKKIEFGHAKLIVIGEELIKADKSTEILDFLTRRPDIQLISWVAAGRPSAEKVVKMVPKEETAAYPALFNFFDDNGTESPYIVTTFLFDFRRGMENSGIDLMLPIIEIDDELARFQINKSLIVANKKEPLELNSLNTLMFNMLSKNANVANLIIKEKGQHFIARIDTIKSDYKAKVQNDNQLHLDIKISLYGYISESKLSMNNRKLPEYSNLLKTETKKKLTGFLTEMINAGYDPLGFGLNYRASTLHNERMNTDEWSEAYKNAKINLEVTAGLKSTGSIQ